MTDIFVSYSRADDEAFVKRLYRDLTDSGFHIWWDTKSMDSRGIAFPQVIRDAIASVERLVLVIGPGAIASEYVRSEWQYALATCKVVVPILRRGDESLAPADTLGAYKRLLPPELSRFHTPDFRADDRYADPKVMSDYFKTLAGRSR